MPKHVFEPFKGASRARRRPTSSPSAPAPTGSSTSSRATCVKAELNPNYHVPNRPFFDTLELKGGGDAASAARAVLQTGEYDYAWNMQVEDDILLRLEQGGQGSVEIVCGGEHRVHPAQLQPIRGTEVDGERSSPKSKHPFLTDPAVRQALTSSSTGRRSRSRSTAAQGQTSANFLNAPPVPLDEHEVGVQHRQGQRAARRRRAGSAGPTASAPRTASG